MSTEATTPATAKTDEVTVRASFTNLGPEAELGALEIKVDGSVERAIGRLKRAMAREGVLKEVKNRRFYEKPSVKDKRKRREAERRRRRAMRARRQERR
jgi:small subunit ribosomal protein S21